MSSCRHAYLTLIDGVQMLLTNSFMHVMYIFFLINRCPAALHASRLILKRTSTIFHLHDPLLKSQLLLLKSKLGPWTISHKIPVNMFIYIYLDVVWRPYCRYKIHHSYAETGKIVIRLRKYQTILNGLFSPIIC